MKGYEIIFIVDPNTTDENQQSLLDKVKEVYTANGGEVVQHTTWGRRKLAYRINKLDYGIYHLLYCSRTHAALTEVEHQFRFSPDVIKWQTIAVDDLEQEYGSFERLKNEGSLAQKISDRGR